MRAVLLVWPEKPEIGGRELHSQANFGAGCYALSTKRTANETARPPMDGRARSHQPGTTVGDGAA